MLCACACVVDGDAGILFFGATFQVSVVVSLHTEMAFLGDGEDFNSDSGFGDGGHAAQCGT